MSKEEETRLKALLEKLEGINERGRVKYEAILEESNKVIEESRRARREAEEARRELEEARREAEREHQETLRVHEETQKELEWWESVKALPLEERVREICNHYGGQREEIALEDRLNLFPWGEA